MASLLEQKRNASAKDGRATRVSCAAKSDRSRFIRANSSNKIRFCGSCRAQPSLFSKKNHRVGPSAAAGFIFLTLEPARCGSVHVWENAQRSTSNSERFREHPPNSE